ncbi:patatin-like phospholipase family protein [Aquicoccus sp. G2-2]|uniref:patatin-like phospholipase family protein n=1 Tax=Aquicoccus sp. G2-2 TaxID=3092120 RepID=UPI002AE01CED|nr:patatin-like phospholipase family protein [Aquicoccus sp. G2-2]MEA1114889.1 patatin-like phospholipase family protein [Aquicoccus sp. G2-2]
MSVRGRDDHRCKWSGYVASKEDCVFVFQGGGALGSYQAGAAETLAANGILPGWIAGVSIGAINAAILCGNPRLVGPRSCPVSGKRSPPAPPRSGRRHCFRTAAFIPSSQR